MLDEFLFDVANAAVEGLLFVRLLDVPGDFIADEPGDLLDQRRRRHNRLILERIGLAHGGHQVELAQADRVDGLLRHFEDLDHVLFADFVHLALDHDDGVAFAGHHEVHVAMLQLSNRRIDDKRTVDPADAHLGDRAVEGSAGQQKRYRSTVAGEHVAVVFAIGRDDRADDLYLVAEPVGKERADGPVDQA